MELVLLNLFVNAVDAMPNGGDLMVTTRKVDASALTHWSERDPTEQYIEIRISDSGMGMDTTTMDRIFEPFFTTKEIGRGTGLGLASVYGVVKNHHADIRVASDVGKGSTFTLWFQASAEATEKGTRSMSEVIPYPHGRKVLLVDDEPPILEYIGEMIQTLGFSVIRAASGKEAVRIYETSYAAIDVVVLDMIMPEMDGRDVYRLLEKINPDVKVIIASGYGLIEQSEDILGHGSHLMLSKPFTREELAACMARLLKDDHRSTTHPGIHTP